MEATFINRPVTQAEQHGKMSRLNVTEENSSYKQEKPNLRDFAAAGKCGTNWQ